MEFIAGVVIGIFVAIFGKIIYEKYRK